MKIFVTFSNDYYRQAREFNTWTAIKIAGFDKTYSLTPKDIDEKFKSKNEKILSYPKGAGLWLWKPWAVKYALDRASDGDYVFYTDAASFWVNKVDHIIHAMTQDIWICENSLIEEQFTKPILFKLMDCEELRYRKTRQRPAIFIGIRKTPISEKVISEWLEYCQQEEYIKPEDERDINEGINVGFISHREDQSILSLITKKYEIEAHMAPSLSGRHPEFEIFPGAKYLPTKHKIEYPICIIHHRERTIKIGMLLKNLLMLLMPSFLISLYAKRKVKETKS